MTESGAQKALEKGNTSLSLDAQQHSSGTRHYDAVRSKRRALHVGGGGGLRELVGHVSIVNTTHR